MLSREKITINGIVQGVGFRPFVYNLARKYALAGYVRNNSAGVLIEIEGLPKSLNQFREGLRRESPPLAQIVSCEVEPLRPKGDRAFAIEASERGDSPVTLISPDICVCPDCLEELFDPTDRRYRYPFINCTNCGPRYTIVRSLPYDRLFTSMAEFDLCATCEQEYRDSGNRRFHAQPNACPDCGPQLSLKDNRGRQIETSDVVQTTVALLQEGEIVAVRGLGGFHLAVNAFDESAVQELRRRKGRRQKPFALMAPDMDTVRKFCRLSEEEQAVLQSPQRPIVILRALSNLKLAPSIAPGTNYLGFMLPYTPLHYVLLRDNFQALVMTSANFAEEPIAIGNDEAEDRLKDVADFFLLHDREILQRCDDSIVSCVGGAPRLFRRSRGYVPQPVFLKKPTEKRILACGAELKNSIALSRGDTVFLSQHIGDLDNPAAFTFYENSINHLQKILEIKPEAIAYDLHPEYLSTKWALEQQEIPKVGVQHHHAHLVSVLAENQVEERAIGIILDGTGYGSDGTIWGGEILIGDTCDFERFAWLSPVALPGGAAAIRAPWRMAVSFLKQAFGEQLHELNIPILKDRPATEVQLIEQIIEKNINSPLTSSCGRLFDAVAAILNIRGEINYEAQAAIELEMCIDVSEKSWYKDAVSQSEPGEALGLAPLIRAVVRDYEHGISPDKIAARFHRSLAELFLRSAVYARSKNQIELVALSGGVFQNKYFFNYLVRRLEEEKFRVVTHKLVPTNDGGIALGQIVIADQKLRKLKL